MFNSWVQNIVVIMQNDINRISRNTGCTQSMRNPSCTRKNLQGKPVRLVFVRKNISTHTPRFIRAGLEPLKTFSKFRSDQRQNSMSALDNWFKSCWIFPTFVYLRTD